jgi:hypothetical protein
MMPEPERKLWLQLLEGGFKLIYKDAQQRPQGSLIEYDKEGNLKSKRDISI